MEYLIGLILGLTLAGFAAIIGFDRDRAFYPIVLIVIASYYVLFAVIGVSGRILIVEIVVAGGFLLFAVVGFKTTLWLVVAPIVGHGVFEFVHHLFIENPGAPHWWLVCVCVASVSRRRPPRRANCRTKQWMQWNGWKGQTKP